MMKILWLSNVLITDSPTSSSGGWVKEMYKQLISTGEVEINNLALTDSCNIEYRPIGNKPQWSIPRSKSKKWEKLGNKFNKRILEIIMDYSPDIIHIWGIETVWSIFYLNCLKHSYDVRYLIEIQGLMFACQKYFYIGLGKHASRHLYGLLDYLFPRYKVSTQEKWFSRIGEEEIKVIKNSQYINTQSEYVRTIIKTINPELKLFKTSIILRKEFIECQRVETKKLPLAICTVTSRATYKGLHITIQAFSIIKKRYPTLRLKIIGVNVYKYANFGYVSYLLKLSKQLGIDDSIDWLGYLDARGILNIYNESICYINSSFVETYCLSLAEALSAGVPAVVSHSAAMPELAIDRITALTFPLSDYHIAASKILQIIEDHELREQLSIGAYERMKMVNDVQKIVRNQLDIYQRVLE